MDDEKLIDLVQKNQFLYDKKHPDFKNKLKKGDAWNSIANELGCSEEVCMRRWTNMRDRFSKCRKDAQLPSGSGATEASSWYLYDQLNFLDMHIQPRKTRGTYTMSHSSRSQSPTSPLQLTQNNLFNDSCSLSDIIETDYQPEKMPTSVSEPTTPSPAPSRINKKNKEEELQNTIISALGTWQTHCKARQQLLAATSGFATMLAGMVEQLPKEKQARAMRNAMDAVLAEQDYQTNF